MIMMTQREHNRFHLCPCQPPPSLQPPQRKEEEGTRDGTQDKVLRGSTVHGDPGNMLGMAGNDLVSRRRMRRMHKDDPWRDDVLRLEGAKGVHSMMMDTDNTLVVIDPYTNQLKHEDDKGTKDDDRRCRQRQGTRLESTGHSINRSRRAECRCCVDGTPTTNHRQDKT